MLVRIALVFARRGYNIESLAVSPGATAGFARMTIMSRGDPENIEQIIKQLAKLIDVVFVTDHRGEQPVEVEIALIKLRCEGEARKRALAIAEARGARVSNDDRRPLDPDLPRHERRDQRAARTSWSRATSKSSCARARS